MRLESKLDDLLEVRRDQSIDVLLVTESWHDPDSVCVRRLRADGYTVVERARPRVQSATLDMNHGGVLATAAPGVRMSAVDLGLHRQLLKQSACAYPWRQHTTLSC